eukprot:XP_001707975.1 Hypothetical protein GL50803_35691 [Giardia lamblia ATCC 50803]
MVLEYADPRRALRSDKPEVLQLEDMRSSGQACTDGISCKGHVPILICDRVVDRRTVSNGVYTGQTRPRTLINDDRLRWVVNVEFDTVTLRRLQDHLRDWAEADTKNSRVSTVDTLTGPDNNLAIVLVKGLQSLTHLELNAMGTHLILADVSEFLVEVTRHDPTRAVNKRARLVLQPEGLGKLDTDVPRPDNYAVLGVLLVRKRFDDFLGVHIVLAEKDLVALDARDVRDDWPGARGKDNLVIPLRHSLIGHEANCGKLLGSKVDIRDVVLHVADTPESRKVIRVGVKERLHVLNRPVDTESYPAGQKRQVVVSLVDGDLDAWVMLLDGLRDGCSTVVAPKDDDLHCPSLFLVSKSQIN